MAETPIGRSIISGRFSCQNGGTRTLRRTYSLGFMAYLTPTLFMKSHQRSMRSTQGPTQVEPHSTMPKRSFGCRSNTFPITIVCR